MLVIRSCGIGASGVKRGSLHAAAAASALKHTTKQASSWHLVSPSIFVTVAHFFWSSVGLFEWVR